MRKLCTEEEASRLRDSSAQEKKVLFFFFFYVRHSMYGVSNSLAQVPFYVLQVSFNYAPFFSSAHETSPARVRCPHTLICSLQMRAAVGDDRSYLERCLIPDRMRCSLSSIDLHFWFRSVAAGLYMSLRHSQLQYCSAKSTSFPTLGVQVVIENLCPCHYLCSEQAPCLSTFTCQALEHENLLASE